jgi:hypothetical protein
VDFVLIWYVAAPVFRHRCTVSIFQSTEASRRCQTILQDPKYTKPIRRRLVWVRTDKGKEFLNTQFQALLKSEGIEFQVCINPDVKYSVVERVNRSLRDKLYKYFSYKNTYRYIEVLPKFITGYNAIIHSTTGMAPGNVRDTDVLAIWNKVQKKVKRAKRLATLKFRVGQHVRISKEKVKFGNGGEQNYTNEIFKVQRSCTEPLVRYSNSRTCAVKRSRASFTQKN